MTFQWHITDLCNCRCKHCYQDSYESKGLSYKELMTILSQLEEFVLRRGIKQGHINITGGEPFLREDLFGLLLKIKQTGVFSFGILSNGYLPSEKVLTRFKFLRPSFVQISLEGTRETNDFIRGQGSYDTILNALKIYQKLGVPTMLSFTANAMNYKDYAHVVKIGRKYQVNKVWTDRYIPTGKTDPLQLTTDQFRILGELMRREQQKDKYYIGSKTLVAADRALQFLFCGGRPYHCSAGNSLLAILSDGELVPCRRLPIKIGNLLTDDLNHLYDQSETLHDLRLSENQDAGCTNCFYKTSCGGGLKCLSYAATGDYHKRDVNCWL